MIVTIAFYMLAFTAVAAAFMVVAARNPVHSVMFLILTFFSAAGLFLLMGAEFLALLLVMVYVGAVAVLFLFVVMMLDVDFAELKAEIAQKQKNISVYRRKKVSAPESSYNPLVTTQSGYDKKIASAEGEIVAAKESIVGEKDLLVKDLARIGMKLDADSIDKLLDSITGDEFMRVSIIFDNAKKFAAELERLTNESGEDLETAKKYYGVYLMLLKTVSRLQNKFIENVDQEYYPKLDKFADKARQNIADAKKAIRLGGDQAVLENNIDSNRLTYDAAMFYKQGLAEQKHQMMLANLATKKSILTAANTYKTVALSKDVAELMAVSRRAFNSITGLEVPDLRPFENQKMRKAFSEMTRELRSK